MREHSAAAKKFYNSKAWRKTRDAYIGSVDYMCERCGDAGYIVHHIEHIDSNNINDVNVTLNWDNLEYLCLDCHNTEHFATHSNVVDGVTFNQFGELVPIRKSKNDK